MTNTIVVQEMGLSETMELGKILAQSGYFQDSKDAAQAIVKILAGRELGFGPIASMTGINVIKGKVALSSNLMAASIKRSGKYNYRVTSLDDTGCTVEFYEGSNKIGVSTFTMADAKTAGLAGDNWKKFPKNMCFARAISNGAKWYCPDLSGGPVYTPDELGAEIDGETGEMLDITPQPAPVVISEPVQVTTAKAPERKPVAPAELEEKVRNYTQYLSDNPTVGGKYFDNETFEPLPVELHPFGKKTAGLIAKKMSDVLESVDTYHAVLEYLTGCDSAKKLTAAQAAALIRLMFNGSAETVSFETPVTDIAITELKAVAALVTDNELPF